ncbi:hypothetical protein ACFL1B_02820 [Nanoarchaeota archaeon]
MSAIGGLVEKIKGASPKILCTPVEVVSMDEETSEAEMHRWGVERTEEGFDTSALASQLYEATRDSFNPKHLKHSGVEFCTFPDHYWIHGDFWIGGPIEYLFRIDAHIGGLVASVTTRTKSDKAKEVILQRLGRLPVPFNDGVYVVHQESPGETAALLSPKIGVYAAEGRTFAITPSGDHAADALFSQVGVRMMEMLRLTRTASENKTNPSFGVKFPEEGEFLVYQRGVHGCGISPIVAAGKVNSDSGFIEVSYSGLVNKGDHPSCHIDRMQENVQQHFSG